MTFDFLLLGAGNWLCLFRVSAVKFASLMARLSLASVRPLRSLSSGTNESIAPVCSQDAMFTVTSLSFCLSCLRVEPKILEAWDLVTLFHLF